MVTCLRSPGKRVTQSRSNHRADAGEQIGRLAALGAIGIPAASELLELIAHALRLQLTYLSKDQALAVADTILRILL